MTENPKLGSVWIKNANFSPSRYLTQAQINKITKTVVGFTPNGWPVVSDSMGNAYSRPTEKFFAEMIEYTPPETRQFFVHVPSDKNGVVWCDTKSPSEKDRDSSYQYFEVTWYPNCAEVEVKKI